MIRKKRKEFLLVVARNVFWYQEKLIKPLNQIYNNRFMFLSNLEVLPRGPNCLHSHYCLSNLKET